MGHRVELQQGRLCRWNRTLRCCMVRGRGVVQSHVQMLWSSILFGRSELGRAGTGRAQRHVGKEYSKSTQGCWTIDLISGYCCILGAHLDVTHHAKDLLQPPVRGLDLTSAQRSKAVTFSRSAAFAERRLSTTARLLRLVHEQEEHGAGSREKWWREDRPVSEGNGGGRTDPVSEKNGGGRTDPISEGPGRGSRSAETEAASTCRQT
jgi:hypothetical protein